MSNTSEQLSAHDTYLIESFKEQAAAWKHEDNLLYRFTSIILPLSIAALAVPYIEDRVPDLLATIGGLTLMTFWAISCQIADIKSNIRLSIINKIEKCWNVWGHKNFKDIRDDTYGEKASRRLRDQCLRRYMFWVYLSIIGVLTLYRTIDCMWSAQWECKTVIISIAEIIVTFILGTVFGVFTALAMCKARKKVRVKSKDKTDSSEKGS